MEQKDIFNKIIVTRIIKYKYRVKSNFYELNLNLRYYNRQIFHLSVLIHQDLQNEKRFLIIINSWFFSIRNYICRSSKERNRSYVQSNDIIY